MLIGIDRRAKQGGKDGNYRAVDSDTVRFIWRPDGDIWRLAGYSGRDSSNLARYVGLTITSQLPHP